MAGITIQDVYSPRWWASVAGFMLDWWAIITGLIVFFLWAGLLWQTVRGKWAIAGTLIAGCIVFFSWYYSHRYIANGLWWLFGVIAIVWMSAMASAWKRGRGKKAKGEDSSLTVVVFFTGAWVYFAFTVMIYLDAWLGIYYFADWYWLPWTKYGF